MLLGSPLDQQGGVTAAGRLVPLFVAFHAVSSHCGCLVAFSRVGASRAGVGRVVAKSVSPAVPHGSNLFNHGTNNGSFGVCGAGVGPGWDSGG